MSHVQTLALAAQVPWTLRLKAHRCMGKCTLLCLLYCGGEFQNVVHPVRLRQLWLGGRTRRLQQFCNGIFFFPCVQFLLVSLTFLIVVCNIDGFALFSTVLGLYFSPPPQSDPITLCANNTLSPGLDDDAGCFVWISFFIFAVG
jgi:hypothetical protein